MKFKLLLLLLFLTGSIFSQSEIYYLKDSSNNLTPETVLNKEFLPLQNRILEKYSNSTFWFKIPSSNTHLKYVIRINSIRANYAQAYQNLNEIKKLNHQRYTTFKFSREHPLYVKVNTIFSPNFPVDLKTEEDFYFKEQLNLIIISFYYGIAFLVILFSINYYYFFKDKTFIYFAFLLISLTFSFLISDGVLTFFNIDYKIIEILILLDYVLLAYCSSKFCNSFLLIDNFYPKVKKYAYVIGVNLILFVFLFLILRKNELYMIINISVFILLFTYWFIGVLLFNRSVHNRVFTLGYVVLLFSGLDFFVLKNFGISLFNSSPLTNKLGGFIQIMALSFAVLFREKNLRKYNFFMKNEIKKFSKELAELSLRNNEEPKKESIENLSVREREIFDLITFGKSNKEIASEANISVNTVKFHVKNIYGKLNIKKRKDLLFIDNSFKR